MYGPRPQQFQYDTCDEAREFANFTGFYGGTYLQNGRASDAYMGFANVGSFFRGGTALPHPNGGIYDEQQLYQGAQDETWPEPEGERDADLMLARQISLRQAMELSVGMDDFDEYSTAVDELLCEDGVKDQILCDVHEERQSGATVVVPLWLTLNRDPTNRVEGAVHEAESIELTISLRYGATLRARWKRSTPIRRCSGTSRNGRKVRTPWI